MDGNNALIKPYKNGAGGTTGRSGRVHYRNYTILHYITPYTNGEKYCL
ncbi:hypothetical protein NVP2275O_156 [Vibrio phage 2.275.O._10N.286.54.E11]|nr:hypothetical protein NVP2275O_156 [Vibrio phage 2.275.O._10N.286.54.E11]